MPKLEEVLIDRLTLRPEVREKARALLRTVHSKTGPGTGYEIGEAKTGLPAICAYLASKRYARDIPVYAFSSRVLITGNALVLAMRILLKTLRRRRPALHPRHLRARSRQSKLPFGLQGRRTLPQVNLVMKPTRLPMPRSSANIR